MSARDQARRDVEFDALLRRTERSGEGCYYNDEGITAAYELGKRHGREEIEVKVAYSHSFMPRDVAHVRADEVKP